MEAQDYKALQNLLEKVSELKAYEYNNAHSLAAQFLTLGKKSINEYATEDYDEIIRYLESSQKSKSEKVKVADWEAACGMLYDNIEIIIIHNAAD